MGEGLITTLPMVIAEELCAEWSRIRVEIAPVAPAYDVPFMRHQLTGGGHTLNRRFRQLRLLGAAGREMLVTAAARRWGVSKQDCTAEASEVLHPPSGRSLDFGASRRREAAAISAAVEDDG